MSIVRFRKDGSHYYLPSAAAALSEICSPKPRKTKRRKKAAKTSRKAKR